MDAVTILCNESIKAFGQIARQKGITYSGDADYERISVLLKTHMKANLDNILTEWKEATEANIGNGWLSTMIKTQAIEIANKAIIEFRS